MMFCKKKQVGRYFISSMLHRLCQSDIIKRYVQLLFNHLWYCFSHRKLTGQIPMRQIVYRFGKGWSQELAAAFSCLHTRFQAAPGAADGGMQSPPGFCFSEQGGKVFFSPPSSGKQEIILIKALPHTDRAGKRWSLATLTFVLQMQSSNYCKVSNRMARLTGVYPPQQCYFQAYSYFIQSYL